MILELIGKIILWLSVGLGGCILLFAIIYLASGIQARAWLAVMEKYIDQKFNKLKNEEDERKNEQFPGQSN
jgi:hypothetical protein